MILVLYRVFDDVSVLTIAQVVSTSFMPDICVGRTCVHLTVDYALSALCSII